MVKFLLNFHVKKKLSFFVDSYVFNQSFSDRFCVLMNSILNKYYGKDIG